MPFTFRPVGEASVRAFLAWRYEPPYDIYNGSPEGIELELPFFMDPQNGYFCIFEEDNELVAFCCFGQDAQVPGGDYSAPALDIGLGVRPDLTGQGRGLTFVEAVLDFARQTFAPVTFRVTIAAFNRRAQHVWEKAGFYPVQTFQRQYDDLDFVVMIRNTALPPLECQPNV